ncbi:MAG: NADP-dependent oxidoreductase [Deltaproteobacteria bacterium]|nr:MAG: NADP-dependent oxidoreductase [Deltaproteobacteria bacterium]
MRAAVLHEYGPPENLRIEEVDCPPVGPRDVKVRVRASSLNPIDWKCRAGTQRLVMGWKLPWVQGMDLAGEVVEIGAEVEHFAVGDEVWSSPSHKRWGTWAEFCVVDEAELGHKPPSLSMEEAASIPLAGQTAWQCLVPHVSEGDRVFIQAGSGGVGTLAIQIAKAHGAWVATTCSERNHALVRELGADRAVDYRSENWWEALDELDLILDSLGGEERWRALRSVKRGGRVANITTGLPHNVETYGAALGTVATGLGIARFWAGGKLRGVDAATVVRSARRDLLDGLAGLIEEGKLAPCIDRVYPLEEIAEAHRYGETGRIRGKVVLRVD